MKSIVIKKYKKLFGLLMFLSVFVFLETNAFSAISIGCG